MELLHVKYHKQTGVPFERLINVVFQRHPLDYVLVRLVIDNVPQPLNKGCRSFLMARRF